MIERVKIAVCDDESRALSIIASSVGGIFGDLGGEISLDTFTAPGQLLERMAGYDYDLLFLDISMPRMDGIALGKQLQTRGSKASIVFVSSRMDRVFDTFAVEPFGFVRKSHFLGDLNEVITRFWEKWEKQQSQGDLIYLKNRGSAVAVDVSRVRYIECIKNTQVLHFEGEQTQRKVYSRMETLEEELEPYNFLRVHKGYLVNSRFIASFDAKTVVLIDGVELPVGRSYYAGVKAGYLAYISAAGVPYIGN